MLEPGLLEQATARKLLKRYGLVTEQACLGLIRRYIRVDRLRSRANLTGLQSRRSKLRGPSGDALARRVRFGSESALPYPR